MGAETHSTSLSWAEPDRDGSTPSVAETLHKASKQDYFAEVTEGTALEAVPPSTRKRVKEQRGAVKIANERSYRSQATDRR